MQIIPKKLLNSLFDFYEATAKLLFVFIQQIVTAINGSQTENLLQFFPTKLLTPHRLYDFLRKSATSKLFFKLNKLIFVFYWLRHQVFCFLIFLIDIELGALNKFLQVISIIYEIFFYFTDIFFSSTCSFF